MINNEKFWSKVDIGPTDQCWPWQGSKSKYGYGVYCLNKKIMQSHRWAYLFTYGDIPEGKYILHKCDNPACCNPHHLYAGTQRENVCDMYNRNRAYYQNKARYRTIPIDPRLASWPYKPNDEMVDLMDIASILN